MEFTITQTSLIVAVLGIASFIFGVLAENKKPAAGEIFSGKDYVKCKYPKDPTVAFGYLSVVFLLASNVAAYFSIVYPYKGQNIPFVKLIRSTSFLVFINIALFCSVGGLVFLLWPTITEQLHLTRNTHHNLETTCPTAKTGLLGGGALLSLGSACMWLVTLMLAQNAREDYFEEAKKGSKTIENHA